MAFFFTNACELQCFVQFGTVLNRKSTYAFLIIGRNGWHDFILYFSVLALTEAMRGRLLEFWISLTLHRICFMSELLKLVRSLIADYMNDLLSDIRRNRFLFTSACKLKWFVQFGQMPAQGLQNARARAA